MATDNKVYDDYSNPYDRILLNWDSYLDLRDLHLSFCNNLEKILDFGTGTGNQAVELAKNGKDVYAIDINDAMIDFIKNKYSGDNLKASIMSIQDVDFEDNSFDAVTSMNVIYNVPEPMKAMSEAYRVTKPEGVFLVSGPAKNANVEQLTSNLIDTLKEKGLYDSQTQKDVEVIHNSNKHLVSNATLFSASSMADALLSSGFSEVLAMRDDLYLNNAYFVAVKK